ncbi:dinitrogenase reductase activating glycohydrolase [Azoarcus sp. CIB]|nr:dinitrogenase reductase activating glycohydrolase [Azoarcus sp. CIB]
MKAKWTNCKLVLSFRSQFFQWRRHFSIQANDRSTTHS